MRVNDGYASSAVVRRDELGFVEIVSMPDEFVCSGDLMCEMIDTHNKYQIIVNAAKIIAANQDDTGDVDLYMSGLDDLVAGVAAL